MGADYTGAEHTYIVSTIRNDSDIAITESYILPNDARQKILKLPNPFESAYAEATYFRSYSRKKEDGSKELWADTIIRVIEGVVGAYITHMKRNRLIIDMHELDEFASGMAISAYYRRWLPPGRGLFAMGTQFTRINGNVALNNCYACDTRNIVKSVSWGMDVLMCGGGLGFDCTWDGIVQKPDMDNSFLYSIPDTRQGCISAIELLVESYIKGTKHMMFDYSLIRPRGTPIKLFGGTAPGSEPLRILIERIRAFFDIYSVFYYKNITYNGLELTSVMIKEYTKMLKHLHDIGAYSDSPYDIDRVIADTNKAIIKYPNLRIYNRVRLVGDVFNAICGYVASCSIRRGSEIYIGDVDNEKEALTFINLKNPDVNPDRAPWMWNSNNSVRFRKNEDFEKWVKPISQLIRKNGEPGIINLINIRKFGRFTDVNFGEDVAELVNPCGEITLCPFEPCTLSTVIPYNCRTNMSVHNSPIKTDEVVKACQYATFYASTVTTIPHHWSESQAIIARNRRIGVGFGGITNIYENYGNTELTTMSRMMYHLIREYNREFAQRAGIPRAIRCTTIKPEGTLSIIAEVNAGVHFAICEYARRRVGISEERLIEVLRNHGYEIEDSTYVKGMKYVCFPITSKNTRATRNVSIYEQFLLSTSMQRHYSDNSVSFTGTFLRSKEGEDVERVIAAHISMMKSCSMIGQDDYSNGSNHVQLPFEEISKEEYERMISNIKPIDWSSFIDSDPNIPTGCNNDYCQM